MAQLVEHWLPKPRVAGSSPVYRSKIIGCTNQRTLFFSPTTNHTNHTNNHLALVKGEDGALGVLRALRELRVIAQPIQPSTPPTSVRFPFHNEISEICGIRVRHPTTKSASVRFPTHKEISEIRGICVRQVLHQGVRTQKKRRAPRGVRCTPCDWNQSNPISESLIIHLFQV